MLGVRLQIPGGQLEAIEANCQRNPQDCLLDMLQVWLKQIHPPPSWASIIDALEFLREEQLAKKLREQYNIH